MNLLERVIVSIYLSEQVTLFVGLMPFSSNAGLAIQWS